MITSTVEIKEQQSASFKPLNGRRERLLRFVATFAVVRLSCCWLVASPVAGPWMPLFKGVDHAVGTNDPAIPGNFPRWQTVRCVRVDLTDPDVHLLSTLKAPGYVAESRETLTLTVPDFVQQNGLQIGCDANYYNANPGGSDPTGEGISCEVYGLQISSGTIVSAEVTADLVNPRYAAILFTTNNRPAMAFLNRPPGTNTAGIYTAITGYYPIVSNGVNIGAASINAYQDPTIHQVQPRTAFGVSQSNRYLYLMTIDGRQSGYSDGALDTETAYWLLQFGAWNGINMDGGGSTTLYMADSAGNPVGLNHSSYLAAYGHERYIGSHFGVYAKPLPGFINDVIALPDDTAATITWSTVNPASTLVQYGLTTNLGSSSTYSSVMVTNHAALLTGLSPGADYFYRVFSSDGSSQYSSGIFHFSTTNYATSAFVFDVTNSWIYGTANLDGVNWTAPGYDASGWTGAGPGLLWADSRGPNPNISLLDTQMPLDPATTYPYHTYYFLTHFTYTNSQAATSLVFTDYVDDGAVFYLNGVEIYRLRMTAAPTPISNSMLAIGFPCSGDATCPDTFSITGDLMTNLVSGDNLLAVEVHNYNAQSPDITFGMALASTVAFDLPPQLGIEQSNTMVTVSWTRGGFKLQQADSPAGPWADAPGPISSSPFTTTNSGSAQYFRLIR